MKKRIFSTLFRYSGVRADPVARGRRAERLRTLHSILGALVCLSLTSCTDPNAADSVDQFFDADNGTGNSAFVFSPETLDMGLLRASSETKTETITASNRHSGPVYVNDVTGSTSQYSVVSDNCPRAPIPLAAKASCQFTVSFSPTSPGIHGATVNVVYGLDATNSVAFKSIYGVTGTGVGTLQFDGLESVTAVTTTKATLNWTHHPDASQYFVFRVNGDGGLTLLTQLDPPTASFQVTGLTPATAYNFRVRATDLLGVLDSNTVDRGATTDALGSFAVVADIAAAEGATQSTAALSCTDAEGSSATFSVTNQTDTDANCAINAGAVRCTPTFKTGHSGWFSDVTVTCDMNDSTYDRTFRLNVSDTNRAPVLDAIGNQSVDTGSAITPVNAADGGDDQDADLDTLTYTCTFAGGGFGAGTNCTSLPAGAFSFTAGTGALTWTPSQAAAVGGVTTVYTLTITGSDQQGVPLTDTEDLQITVTPSVSLTDVVDFIPANGTDIVAGNALPTVNINNVTTGDDAGMAYTCVFDQVVDAAVGAGTNCTSLPGTATFGAGTGVLDWTPPAGTSGFFEILVSGTKSGNTDTEIFLVYVNPGYVVTNRLFDLEAAFGTGTGPASNPNSSWQDLTSNNLDGGLLGTAASGWAGAGTGADPYRVQFDGTSRMDMGNALSGQANVAFSTWVRPTSIATANAAILNAGGGTDGILLEQSGTGSLMNLVIGGRDVYSARVQALSPLGYWRLGELAGTTAVASAGGINGTYAGAPTLGQAGAPTRETDTSVGFDANNDKVTITIPTLNTGAGTWVTTAFWMKWDGTDSVMPMGFDSYDLYFRSGHFGFNTAAGDVWGISSAGLSGEWVHVVAMFFNGSATSNRLFINGTEQVLTQRLGTTGARTVTTNFQISGWPRDTNYEFGGELDEFAIWNGQLSDGDVASLWMPYCASQNTFSDNAWYHLGVRYDGSTGAMYVNGREECTFAAGSAVFTPQTDDLSVAGSAADSNYWTGDVGSVRAYTSAATSMPFDNFFATANQYRTQPLGTVSSTDLVLLWDASNAVDGLGFEGVGCPAGNWFNLSALANDAVPQGFAGCGASTGWNGTGVPADPYRISMNGGDDAFSANPVVDFPTTAATVEMWVRTSASGEGVFSYAVASNSNHFLLFNQSNLQIFRNSSVASGVSINDGQWHHVVVTWTSVGGAAILYKDGAPVFNTTLANGTPLTAGGSFMLGQEQDSVGGGFDVGQAYDGDVAYTAVYKRVLTPTEVSAHCAAHASRYAGVTCN